MGQENNERPERGYTEALEPKEIVDRLIEIHRNRVNSIREAEHLAGFRMEEFLDDMRSVGQGDMEEVVQTLSEIMILALVRQKMYETGFIEEALVPIEIDSELNTPPEIVNRACQLFSDATGNIFKFTYYGVTSTFELFSDSD